MTDGDFFVQDEPIEELLAAFDAAPKFITQQPTRYVSRDGVCSLWAPGIVGSPTFMGERMLAVR